MKIPEKLWKLFVILLVIFSFPVFARVEKESNDSVFLTWMSNTNWLVEVGDTRILLDGWITRIARLERPDLKNPETLNIPPVKPDVSSVKRVLEALDINNRLDYIFSGHSHFDHSFDTAVWARLTGAKIIGPKSTCLQAMAQGIPESQCTIVRGGETFNLGEGLSVRVVQWNHSGDPSTPFGLLLQTPMELSEVPKPDPITGSLKPGMLDHFPHGGVMACLFILNTAEGKITWFYSNSGNASTFKKPVAVDQVFLRKYGIKLNNLAILPQNASVEKNLMSVMAAEELDGVHLLIGYGSSKLVEQVIPILRPKVFIPQHWGGLWASFFDGLSRIYKNPQLEALLIREGINLLPQQQYMDKYKLDKTGTYRVSNETVKKKLGFKK